MATAKKSTATATAAAEGPYLGARISPHADTKLLLTRAAVARGKAPTLLGHDDDSGHERNAELKVALKKGERVQIKVRVRYVEKTGEAALMVW